MTESPLWHLWLGGGSTSEDWLVALYGKIRKAVEANALAKDNKNCVTVMIDDISLMEVVASGSSNHVLDFLHYCHTLTSEFVRSILDSFLLCSLPEIIWSSHSHTWSIFTWFWYQACSIVALNHADLYSSMEGPTLLLHKEYLADLLIKVEPLATGLATDIHGQVLFCCSSTWLLWLSIHPSITF